MRPGRVVRLERVAGFLQSAAGGVEGLPIEARGAVGVKAQVVDVLDQVRPNALGQLGFATRHARDRREHQARGVEDGPQGADPGQVVVARAEEAQQRVGDVRVEHLDRPALPLEEQVREPPHQAELGVVLEQRHGRGRRSGRGLERDDPDLTPLVRAVEREQEGHDERDGPEAGDRGDHDDDAGRRVDRDDVAEPQRQDGARREVHGAAEIRRHGPQLVTQGEEDQAVPHDERDEPGPQQGDGGRRGEEPEDRVVGLGRAPGQDGPQAPPRAAHDVAADAEPAGRRARDDDRLEQVPEGEGQEEHAQGEDDHVHRMSIIPRPRGDGQRTSRPDRRAERRTGVAARNRAGSLAGPPAARPTPSSTRPRG